VIVSIVAVLVFAIILIIVFFKVFKNLLKTVGLAILLLLLIALIFGVVLSTDAKQFRESFETKPTTYILEDDGHYLAGFEAVSFNFTSIKSLTVSEIQARAENDSQDIRVFINKSALNTTTGNFSLLQELNLSIESALKQSNANLRAHAFMSSLVQTIAQNGVLYIFKRTRTGEVKIKPESLTVRILQMSNINFLNKLKRTVSVELPKKNLSNISIKMGDLL